MDIQWYPGHMAKAKRSMQESLKIVDLIIEITDARAPQATRNPDTDALAKGKGRVIVLGKADLANETKTQEWVDYFKSLGMQAMSMDSRTRVSLNSLYKMIECAGAEKRERDKKRGILNRPLRAMVTGIPNVGKSTLINSTAGKSMAKTGNKPGITKGNQWIRLNKNVDLLDTPGILWPRIDDKETGLKLAFIGSVNDNNLDMQELAKNLIRYLIKINPDFFKEHYGINLTSEQEILSEIAKKKSCITTGAKPDITKAAVLFITEFRNGKLGRITLETAPVK